MTSVATIDMAGKITAADACDAMTSDRVYRNPLPREKWRRPLGTEAALGETLEAVPA
ncbi:MAG: hypothetical protein Q8R28_06935 [Dehalococcoidia bacterium]|nr:hypothetical protein [Dehalococcoidia bacterium]